MTDFVRLRALLTGEPVQAPNPLVIEHVEAVERVYDAKARKDTRAIHAATEASKRLMNARLAVGV